MGIRSLRAVEGAGPYDGVRIVGQHAGFMKIS